MRDMQTDLEKMKAFHPYREQTRFQESAFEAPQAALEART
jgi:hypothetical protein